MDEDLAAGCPGHGTAEGIDAIDLFTGHRVWSNVSYAALDLAAGVAAVKATVVEDVTNRLRLDQRSRWPGVRGVRNPVRGGGEWEPLDLRDVLLVGDKIVAHYPRRVLVYEPSTGSLAAPMSSAMSASTAGCFRSRTPRATVACS